MTIRIRRSGPFHKIALIINRTPIEFPWNFLSRGEAKTFALSFATGMKS